MDKNKYKYNNPSPELFTRAMRLIARAAIGSDIKEDAMKLHQDYMTLDSKYKKGQIVWVLENYDGYVPVQGHIGGIEDMDDHFVYLVNDGEMAIGLFREGAIFRTREELNEHLKKIIEE